MTRRNWKHVRPSSLIHALRLCKECAQERQQLSVERIADRMGCTHDSLYKWLGTGRMPAILIPAYELACGCSLVSSWLAASAGKAVIDMPTGRKATQTDMVELNSGFAAALQLLNDVYDGRAQDPMAAVAALTAHLENVAWHRANAAQHANPELEF